MTTQKKNVLYSLALVAAVILVWLYRRAGNFEPIQVQGETMGTTYHMTYFDEQQRNFKPQIDSLLTAFNRALSTYLPDSEITEYNNGNAISYRSTYLFSILEKSKKITEESQGAFDPTVMPLVNAWGFGPGEKLDPDSAKIDSIRVFVGFEKVYFNTDSVWKADPRIQLDFSAIAKGYGVDITASFLEARGVKNSFIEIGGEVLAKGKNVNADRPWEVGILNPESDYDQQSYIAYAKLENKAMATSGNYFNYYEKDNIKYTHTINPKSGYPAKHNMLSASVFADDCATADAWATALMVMDSKEAIKTLKKYPHLGAFLVYSTTDGITTFATQNVRNLLKINL